MSDEDAFDLDEVDEEQAPARRSRTPLLIGLILALLVGGGGFFAVYAGALKLPAAVAGLLGGGHGGAAEKRAKPVHAPEGAPAFVPVGELVVPLGPAADAQYLVIDTEIETTPADAPAIEALRPRILDVFNTFLRAVDESDIEAPSATIRLRAQLLRRVRAVAAPAEARDLLITSFILK
ncbi:MAG: flagellar basal body-associated protein FliL [Pikeienuella sp.]